MPPTPRCRATVLHGPGISPRELSDEAGQGRLPLEGYMLPQPSLQGFGASNSPEPDAAATSSLQAAPFLADPGLRCQRTTGTASALRSARSSFGGVLPHRSHTRQRGKEHADKRLI